jgi:ubiquitin carboxyl-terminal hydrolase 9/24
MSIFHSRILFSLRRAYRGKSVTIIVRFQSQGGRGVDDIDIWSHTNETLGSVRRQILAKVKASPAHARVELHQNGDLINVSDDRRLISEIPIRDKAVSHPCCAHRLGVYEIPSESWRDLQMKVKIS